MLRLTPLLLFISLTLLHPVIADDDAAGEKKWGNLTATFRYDGEPPESKPFLVDKDKSFYKDPIPNPSLIVDAETKGIANVAMWLIPTEEPLALHATYRELAKETVVIDTIKGNISPHIALVWTAQTIELKNSEPIGHSPVATFRDSSQSFSQVGWDGRDRTRKLTRPEPQPVPIACAIHPWESGYILVRDNPYMAVSNREGKLVIKNLPAGEHTFVLWHEKIGYLSEAKRGGKVEKIPKGRLTMMIKPGDNELGEFFIKPK